MAVQLWKDSCQKRQLPVIHCSIKNTIIPGYFQFCSRSVLQISHFCQPHHLQVNVALQVSFLAGKNSPAQKVLLGVLRRLQVCLEALGCGGRQEASAEPASMRPSLAGEALPEMEVAVLYAKPVAILT